MSSSAEYLSYDKLSQATCYKLSEDYFPGTLDITRGSAARGAFRRLRGHNWTPWRIGHLL